MNKFLFDACCAVLSTNEIGNNKNLAYVFSDPDGLRTGKSGYSFGASQFDIENNWVALDCLRDCDFLPKDIKRLYLQNGDISDLNKRLLENKDVIDRYDELQAKFCMDTVTARLEGKVVSDETFVHLVDYHNQFNISVGGKMHQYIKQLNNIAPEDVLNFKLATKWGKDRPDDVHRRYQTIKKYFSHAQR